MTKRNLKYLVYGLILGAWTIFCICELPELQEAQRKKAYEQAIEYLYPNGTQLSSEWED